MHEKSRLIILEGFDRTGKDHLLKTFDDRHKDDLTCKAYFQVIPPTKPDYRKDPTAFRQWLISHIGNQVDELVDLAKNSKKTLMLVRLLLTDVVYSTLFNRPEAVNQFHQKIFENFDVENNVFLFKSYSEYLKRLALIGDDVQNPEYSEEEFYKVNDLYESSALQFEKMGAKSKFYYIKGDQFLDEFIERVEAN